MQPVSRIVAFVSAVMLSASCMVLGVRADDAVVVSPEIMEFYNGEYQNLKPPRAIAVAADGWHYGYSYCPEYRCYINPSASSLAMRACTKTGGRGCRIFAVDDDIKVSYRVIGSPSGNATAVPPESAKQAMMKWSEADVRGCFGPPKDSDVIAGLTRYRFVRESCTSYIMFKDGKVASVEGYGSEPECWQVVQACRK